jgi:hypothetical protein
VLIEKHGTKTRRAWRKLHIGLNAETGEMVATDLTTNDVDDASQLGSLLGQVAEPVPSFTGTAPTTRMASIVLWRATSLRPQSSCRRLRRQ